MEIVIASPVPTMVEALIGEISSLTMEGRGDLISEGAL